jgi:probable phosphoglycerate mutase
LNASKIMTANHHTTQFGLLRHSITLWNEEKRIQGWQDSPLSATGKLLAVNWGPMLAAYAMDRIICSDLGRCRATAELINRSLQLPLHTDERLREQDWGKWSGMILPRLHEVDKERVEAEVAKGWHFQPPGGESRHGLLHRVVPALEAFHRRWPGERLLIICHEGVIKVLLYHLKKRRFLPDESPLLQKGYYLHLLTMEKELAIDQLHALKLSVTPAATT